MNINKNNYESFFIDYFDGNLSAELTAELFLFIESNPELKGEFDSFESISLPQSDEFFPLRDELKRGTITNDNLSWYLTASLEGDLSANEQKLLDEFLTAHPEHQKEVILYKQSVLQPENEIFPGKKSLKQPIPFVFNVSRTLNYAIAAILLLTLIGGGYYLLIKTNQQNKTEIASNPASTIENNSIDNSSQRRDQINHNEQPGLSIKNNPSVSTFATPKNHDSSNNIDQNKNSEPRNKTIKPATKIISNTIELTLTAEMIPESKPFDSTSVIETNPNDVPVAATQTENKEQYLSVWEAIRKGAENNIRKLYEPEYNALASADGTTDNPVRLLNVLEKGIEKVSNEKVTVNSEYDENGKLSIFQFAAGKFKIERKSGF